MIQLNKPNGPLSSPAKTLESDWSSMLTATSIYGKGAPGAPFLFQAADCFMTRQDWISRPTDGGSKRIYLFGITSPFCCACWMQVGRPRFCRMISSLSERRAVPTTRTRPPCSSAFNILCIGQQQIWDIWTYKLGSSSMSSAGRRSTSCTNQPLSFLLAACPKIVEISCCNGFQLYDCKTARGHAIHSRDDALPLGKTSRKWTFKYVPFRHRRRRRTRSMRRRQQALRKSLLARMLQLFSLRFREICWKHIWCTQNSDCMVMNPAKMPSAAPLYSTILSIFTAGRGTRSGPKSGVRANGDWRCRPIHKMCYFFFMISNLPGSDGVKVGPLPMGGPGAPSGAKPHGIVATTAAEAARKRSFRRAVHRASNSCDQATWYRGRYLTLRQLGATPVSRSIRQTGRQNGLANARSDSSRLRIITWNCGGLHDTRYREITQWLCDEHDAGRPVHVMVVQLTAWKHDMEYTTSSAAPHGPQWYVLHSGSGSAEGGIMFFILSTLLKTEQIRAAPIHPGRLFHVRLMLDPPLDMLGVYQHAWNVQKKSLQSDPAEVHGVSKVQQLLQRRRKIWKAIGTWIAGTPRRNGCLILGDLNTSVQPIPSLIGEGVAKPGLSIVQTDYGQLIQLVRTYAMCLLNTWSKAGPSARTFLPAAGSGPGHGAQIDFVMTRGKGADGIAKHAKPIDAPFVPHTGCRHLPVECFLRKPMRPSIQHGPQRMQPQEVRQQLLTNRCPACLQHTWTRCSMTWITKWTVLTRTFWRVGSNVFSLFSLLNFADQHLPP